VFYLVRPYEALLFAAATVLALLPVLIEQGDSTTTTTTTIIVAATVMSMFAFAFSLITNLQREQLVLLATRDFLTGAGNRRHFDDKLLELVNTKQRTESPASILLLDLDNFKKVNDVHGHAVGDEILKRITEMIDLRIRVADSLFRIGGEEFVVLLDELDLKSATHLAEQLRTLVEANELIPKLPVTISLGVAEFNPGETRESWLARADDALYQAKREGRNTSRTAS
jgi:diguanylate cyclase (GGDEF)-like protein